MTVLEARAEVHSLARVLPSGRSLLLGFAVIAGAIGLYAGARSTSVFAVHRVEVQGAPPRVEARVQAALTEPLEGESLLSVDRADIDRALAGLPDVQAIEFDRGFPRTLQVTVVAERPVAVLRRGTDAWLISERGRVLRGLPDARPVGLPRIWIAELAPPKDGTLLKDETGRGPALALGAVLASDPQFLEGIEHAALRGREIDLALRSGVELRLGPPHDLALKVAVAREVLAALPGAYAGYVDVSVPERPVSAVESQVSS
jgi:POTRA domain, FtsQ-type/Cell division protein FtsQ